ncbi:bifunctional enoyl-CoA hydratase/phosphate acetyltransferase [bacterium]|nr:bifunctional enoyl-CoA hydratase/phosphate acetyltransferase [bacterium]
MLKNFAEILERAKTSHRRNLAVADAAGDAVIEALAEAENMGIIKPYLVGDAEKIEPLAKKYNLAEYEIINAIEPEEIAQKTVSLGREGKCDMLMKGKLSTPILLKAVLDRENGLRTGNLLSHIAIMEVEKYPKLMIITDGGMVIQPDLEQRIQIISNAEIVAKKFGIEKPKAVGLAAIEKVTPDMPETVDAEKLTKMSQNGELGDVIFEGPLAMDVVLSKDAAKIKKIETQMAEDADIFLVPNIACGNIFAKALIYLADAKIGGIVMGAKLPIVLLSRSDTAQTKLNSIAIGCVVS